MAVTMNYGAAPTYVKIASQTLASTASSITFSNIPQGYTDLIIVTNFSMTANDVYAHYVQVNGDTGNNYSRTILYGTGTTAASTRQSNNPSLYFGNWNTDIDTTDRSFITIFFNSYSNTTTYKTVMGRHNVASVEVGAGVGTWRNTAAITSINLAPNGSTYVAGSTFTLYGIKAALVPKATGGDLVVNDGQYWYHTYRTSGVFFPNQSLTADVLVVAGGGGSNQGGGGAGGLRAFTSQSLTVATHAITVGAGGTAGSGNGVTPGGVGNNSQFAALTVSNGGGGGNAGVSGAGGAGGSGGGGAQDPGTTTGGAASPSGQGNAGGGNGGFGGDPYPGGGGGGAGAAGGNATSNNQAGVGGNGVNTYSSWGLATATGQNISGVVWYAGGGGGGMNNNAGSTSSGGNGGGGAGRGFNTAALAGTSNTGGGAGGTGQGGASGGSGIVIVRYSI
jgi:hypothetical protein